MIGDGKDKRRGTQRMEGTQTIEMGERRIEDRNVIERGIGDKRGNKG